MCIMLSGFDIVRFDFKLYKVCIEVVVGRCQVYTGVHINRIALVTNNSG